jgi:hypothetical protein
MTDTDRIAQMAREAGLPAQVTAHPAFKQFVKEHARLVAEDCAKVCDGMPYRAAGAGKAAQEIRARYGIE